MNSLSDIVRDFVTQIDNFLNVNAGTHCDKEWLTKKIYQNIKQQFKKINNNNKRKMSSNSTTNIKETTCIAILKSGINRGLLCGSKCINSSYCKKHQNEELENTTSDEDDRLTTINNEIDNELYINKEKECIKSGQEKKMIVIEKNSFGNLEYGTTGLLFKTLKDENGKTINRIVSKQGPNGEWKPLSESDIKLCKKLRLKYQIIDFKKKTGDINTKKFTSKIPLTISDYKNGIHENYEEEKNE